MFVFSLYNILTHSKQMWKSTVKFILSLDVWAVDVWVDCPCKNCSSEETTSTNPTKRIYFDRDVQIPKAEEVEHNRCHTWSTQ